MHAKKNSITLAIILIVFIVVGFLWYKYETNQLQKISKDEKSLNIQFQEFDSILSDQTELEFEYNFLKKKWNNAPKILISSEEPAFSYQFINKIKSEKDIAFDFDFNLTKKISKNNFSAYIYTLKGIGSFLDVYKLIWNLTITPILYNIRSIHFEKLDLNSDEVSFEIEVQSYSIDSKWSAEQKIAEDYEVPEQLHAMEYNSFKPLIARPKVIAASSSSLTKKATTENLVNIRAITLQAVMTDKIFVKDKTGKIKTLTLGEQISGGYLSRIDTKNSEAEFLLGDKAFILGLGYIRESGKVQSTTEENRVLLR
jgi:hypothetical protein